MQVKVKIDMAQFQDRLKTLEGRFQNQGLLMRHISGDLMDAVEENFEKQGRQPGWKQLKPGTIRQRQKHGHWPGKILQQTGLLAVSVAPRHDQRTATVSSNLPYAGIHQRGGMAGRGRKVRIPPRPFMKITQQDYDDIKDRIRRFFTISGE